MKKIYLLMIVLSLLAMPLMGPSIAAEAPPSDGQTIKSYEGNITEKQTISIDLLSLFGGPAPGYFSAETVKFKAPKANWKINKVRLYGWDGYNGSAESIPNERIFSIEIRDKDLNLLYKFADSQLPYSNFARNATGLYPFIVNVPDVSVSGEFYVCFYDRGAIAIACEFVDYKKAGVAAEHLPDWNRRAGWKVLLNTRGLMWKKLSDAERADVDEAKALTLMTNYPALIKRPVLDTGAKLIVGFAPENYAAEFK